MTFRSLLPVIVAAATAFTAGAPTNWGCRVKEAVKLRILSFSFLVLIFSVAEAAANDAASEEKFYFDIPQQQADGALTALGQQADITILYRYDVVHGYKTGQLKGEYTLDEAISFLLEGTSLKTEFSPAGHLIITDDKATRGNEVKPKVNKTSAMAGILAAVASLFGGTGEVSAQATADVSDHTIEEIVVTGIRESIQKARDFKENSDFIGDAYFAEEIGKSSDESITEALQRLPGVTIERGGEGGDQGTVVVRGIEPALNLIKFNGVTLTSNTDSQAVDLSSFSADVLSSIVVAKSARAKDEEGSLGGTIYLESAAPLEQPEDIFIVSAEARSNDVTDDTTPRVSASFSKAFSETLGVSGTLFLDDKETRVDNFETFLGAFTDPRNNPRDAANTGTFLGDRDALADGFSNYRTFDRDTRKQGGTLTFQWYPAEETEVQFDVAYSDQSQDFLMFEDRGIQSSFAQGENQEEGLAVVNTQTGRVVEYYGNLTGLVQTRQQRGDTENLVLGLDVEHQIGNWTFHGKVARSDTDQLYRFQTWNLVGAGPAADPAAADFGPGNGYCGWRLDGGEGPVDLPVYFNCPFYNRNDINTLGLNSGSEAEREVSDTLDAFYFDVSRSFDNGPITSVDAGVKYTDREKDRFFAESFFALSTLVQRGIVDESSLVDTNGDGLLDVLPLTAIGAQGAVVNTPSGVLSGIAPQGSPSVLAADIDGVNAILFPNGVPADLTTRNPGNQWTVEEETFAAYIQANFEFLEGKISGDIGLRYADTEVTGTNAAGFQFNAEFIQPNGDFYPSEFASPDFQDTHSYTELLPSVNVKIQLREDLLLRLSAGRALARPNLDALAPGFLVIDRDPGAAPRGGGGNTRLDPFVADQFDVSLEWYFNDNSLLSAAVFYKDIGSFTFSSTVNRNFANPVTGEPCLVNRSSANPVDRAAATVDQYGCADVLFTTEVNGAEADILGLELGYTQVYDNLPGIWRHLGTSVNYTYADSEAEVSEDPNSVENGFPFPNTSENSLNSTLFWDDGNISLRLAYTYRDEALIQVNNNNQLIARDSRGVLDFSANWNVNYNLVAFFSANNLTDSFDYLYQSTLVSNSPDIPVQVTGTNLDSLPKEAAFRLNHQGRSYRLGVRYTF